MSANRIGEMLQPRFKTAFAFIGAQRSLSNRLAFSFDVAADNAGQTASDRLADALAALLNPAALLALVFALWRVTADIGWTTEFPIAAGFFSHWQVWIAMAIALKAASSSRDIPISSRGHRS
jgi:hypothetical protein